MNALFSEPDEHLTTAFDALRSALAAHGPLPAERRAEALEDLARMVIRHGTDLAEAISRDFGHRSADETRLAELFPVVTAARHARRHLRAWMRPERRPIGMMFRPGRGRVHYQALGLVGIISPWNYPVQLTLLPLVGAIAAGNRVMIKPSELTPETSSLLASLLGELFRPDEVAVVQGGPEVARAFSRLKFDHLFFTGSTAVGREVMKAAAERLVPVTLELGGKTPAIVGPDYPLAKAAERIAVGKLFNAGQTCIAPDFVLVHASQEAAFADAFAAAALRLYPTFEGNPDYSAIISERHRERLLGIVEDARRLGGRVRSLDAETGPGGRTLAPVILTGLPDEAAALRDEIFGPILPIVPYRSLEDAYAYINARPGPLALYLFSDDRQTVAQTLERTVSGGVTVNDTLLHCVQEELPFGGVGDSGMGAYHGEAGFRTFSHAKAVFHQSRFNGSALTRPPYGRRVERLLKWVLR
ncbi:coniferyl aldehyde dehydrogenase [Microvirga pudoricolor]|uniref:coniferyl aldehyde dehydrogenase n=1 Tax=Microvirga pudoricolor TaxID=2778729 RepID=UPI0019526661|nr:coniferyl aldehyde dehydrogenase [Microvirga pudoricolor]MBM6594353.1 coniferyl aldehyde dehydrogenase [Microvirga pudoricolor]